MANLQFTLEMSEQDRAICSYKVPLLYAINDLCHKKVQRPFTPQSVGEAYIQRVGLGLPLLHLLYLMLPWPICTSH